MFDSPIILINKKTRRILITSNGVVVRRDKKGIHLSGSPVRINRKLFHRRLSLSPFSPSGKMDEDEYEDVCDECCDSGNYCRYCCSRKF